MTYVARNSTLINPEAVLAHISLRAGARVADLGCGGHGQFTVRAARYVGRTGIVYAVDILKSALAELAKKARLDGVSNIKPVWANLEVVGATAIPEASLDAALLINVLYQADSCAGILQEARRLLKSTGMLLVVDWKSTASAFGPPTAQRITPDSVQAHAVAAGLRLREQFDVGRFHYGMVFTR